MSTLQVHAYAYQPAPAACAGGPPRRAPEPTRQELEEREVHVRTKAREFLGSTIGQVATEAQLVRFIDSRAGAYEWVSDSLRALVGRHFIRRHAEFEGMLPDRAPIYTLVHPEPDPTYDANMSGNDRKQFYVEQLYRYGPRKLEFLSEADYNANATPDVMGPVMAAVHAVGKRREVSAVVAYAVPPSDITVLTAFHVALRIADTHYRRMRVSLHMVPIVVAVRMAKMAGQDAELHDSTEDIKNALEKRDPRTFVSVIFVRWTDKGA